MGNTRDLAEQNLADYEAFQRKPAASIEHWPVELQVEVTAQCLANCRICLRGEVDRPYGEDLAPGLIPALTPALERAVTFAPFGLGDPLLSPQLFPMMTTARDLGLYQSIYTCGDLLDPPRRALLLAAELDQLVVSISGVTPESYTRFHGVDSLNLVRHNVSRFADELAAQGRSRPGLAINFVVTKSSYDEISGVVDLAESLGISDVLLSPVICSRGKFTSWRWRGTDEQWEALRRWRDNASARHITLGLDTLEWARSPKHDGYCLHPFRQAYVSVDGDVYPCCSGQYAGTEFTLGSLREQSFEAVWFGPTATQFRARILEGDRPKACAECRAAAMCAYSNDAPPDIEHFGKLLAAKSYSRRYWAEPPEALVEAVASKLPRGAPLAVTEPAGSRLGRRLAARDGLRVRFLPDGAPPAGADLLAVLATPIESAPSRQWLEARHHDPHGLRVLFLADGTGPTRWHQWAHWEYLCRVLAQSGWTVADAVVVGGDVCSWFMHLRPGLSSNGFCAHPQGLEPVPPSELVPAQKDEPTLRHLRRLVSQLDARTEELLDNTSVLRDEAAQRDAYIALLRDEAAQRDAYVARCHETIEKLETTASTLQDEAAQRDAYITLLRGEAAQRDETIKDLNVRLAWLEQVLPVRLWLWATRAAARLGWPRARTTIAALGRPKPGETE